MRFSAVDRAIRSSKGPDAIAHRDVAPVVARGEHGSRASLAAR